MLCVFNDTATTEIYTLSLHDALPILPLYVSPRGLTTSAVPWGRRLFDIEFDFVEHLLRLRVSSGGERTVDRKSTRLNSSHANISYAVFCLKKSTTEITPAYCDPFLLL